MKLLPIVATLALSLVSLTSPGSAEACGGYGADRPSDPMPEDTAAIGSAVSVDGATLYVAYPKRPGDKQHSLYGGHFEVERDARFERLVKRLAAGESPQIGLGRARPGDTWRITWIAKRAR
jgi:hypothetical protein